MLELLSVLSITILAVISPGADFAMITRNSLIYGKSAGLVSSFGIAIGVQLHVLYTIIGVGLLLKTLPELFLVIKVIGALYLIYIGYKTFTLSQLKLNSSNNNYPAISNFEAFKSGFLTNALNPKTTLFIVSLFTQVVGSSTPIIIQVLYGIFISFAHFLWFSTVSVFLSTPHIRNKLLKKQQIINRIIGTTLFLLGLALVFNN